MSMMISSRNPFSPLSAGLPDGLFEDVGIFYGHLVHFTDTWSILRSLLYFMDNWYILWSFWYIFLVLVFCAPKNLATLTVWRTRKPDRGHKNEAMWVSEMS
jgi:hypothetical protein